MDLYYRNRNLNNEGGSQRSIAKRLDISRQTVKKYIEVNTHLDVRKPYHRDAEVLTQDVLDFIRSCLEKDRHKNLDKQWHTAKPITEFDQPGPISAYGKTKYEGEKFVQQFADKWFIVRTAWLYGDGKNIVKTMLSLAETHDELSVVCDQLGSPTSAVELACMIHHLEPTENYGTFHGTCEGDTNWADFTEEIFRLKGINVKVNHVTSEEYKRMNPASADRPHYSILDNYMIRLTSGHKMADWKDALKEYLN